MNPHIAKTVVVLSAVTAGLSAGSVAASVVTFESPAYAAGGFLAASTGSSTTVAAFTGLDGWSQSVSNSRGPILAVAASGEYAGGQAAGAGSGITYIGAKQLADAAGVTSFSFDLMRTSTNGEVSIAPWNDVNADGSFLQAESQLLVGALGSAGTFGFRNATFASGTSLSSAAAAINTWYHVAATYDYSSPAAPTATMTVRNLTAGADVDLNGAADGTAFTAALTPAAFGVDPATYGGVVIRVSQTAYVDNVTVGIPEPTSLAVLAPAAGLLALARRRRGTAVILQRHAR